MAEVTLGVIESCSCFSWKHQIKDFSVVTVQEQAAHRGCGVPFAGGTSEPTQTHPYVTAPGDAALQGGWSSI